MATLNRHILSHREIRDAEAYRNGYGVQTLLANVIWLAFSLLMILLAIRFIFGLLGANPANTFANFIYTTSHPFVAPFFSLFHYSVIQTGASRFEAYTLVAIMVYTLIAWLLTSLVTLGRHH